MIIHVVKEGDTIRSIANEYKVSLQRLITENGVNTTESLVLGETIVIVRPKEIYIVKQGDTLESIARENSISMIQLYRNNPYLFEREYILPGDELVISYMDEKRGSFKVNGYAFPFINKDLLRRTLPYLTYLSIYKYQTQPDLTFSKVDDEELIAIAKSYGVAPLMVIDSQFDETEDSLTLDKLIITDLEIQKAYIENLVQLLLKKGFYGVNLTVQDFTIELQPYVKNFLNNMKSNLNKNNLYFMITITPLTVIDTVFEEVDFPAVEESVNSVLLLNLSFGSIVGPIGPRSPVSVIEETLMKSLYMIPTEINNLGLSVIGYVWELPYIEGVSKGHAISVDSVLELARDNSAVILYDSTRNVAYFSFSIGIDDNQQNFITWFNDARSIDAFTQLLIKYNLEGMATWNIMTYYAQLWLIINTQYDIVRVDINGYHPNLL